MNEPTGNSADADLMRRTAAGDREAFATLYRRYHATIFRFARLMTGSNAAADDIVQEVFLSVMRDAGRYDAARAAVPTYLYGSARHLTRRRLLRDRRFVALELVANGPEPRTDHDPVHDLQQRCELTRLRRAILALPSRFREVVVLCDLQDVSYADASAMLGCPVGTVRSRLHRGRALLARTMRVQPTTCAAAAPANAAPSPSPTRVRCVV